MDVKDIKIFLAVYNTGSINKASQQIYMTTQGVSKVIKKLESQLEAPLFIRSNKGVVPTSIAHKLYQQADNLIQIFDNISNVSDVNIYNVTLKVAFSYGILSYLGYDFIDGFSKKYENIKIDFKEETDSVIEEEMKNNKLDLAVIGLPMELDSYNYIPFFSCKHIAVVNISNPLADKDNIAYSDLNNQPIALVGHQFNPYHHNIQRFYRKNVHPLNIIEMSEIINTHLFASQNKGIGISVDFVAYSQPQFQNTVIIPFSDSDCTWDTCIITNKGIKPSVEMKIFMEYLQKYRKESC